MKEKLSYLVHEYSMNKKVIDCFSMEEIYNILTKNYDISDYLKSINIIYSSNQDAVGSFNINLSRINIFYNNIIDAFWEDAKLFNYTEIEKYYFVNLQILAVILHEFEHVLQRKELSSPPTDIKTRLIYYGKCFSSPYIQKAVFDLTLDDTKLSELYDKTYLYNPIERMAEINACSQIVEVIQNEGHTLSRVSNYFRLLLVKTMNYGYKIDAKNKSIICPSFQYLNEIGKIDTWKRFDFYSPLNSLMLKKVKQEYSLEDRILLGLPVSCDEYDIFSYRNVRKKIKL